MIKRKKEGRGFNFFHFMLDLQQGPMCSEETVWLRLRNGVSGSYPMGRSVSMPSVCWSGEIPV